MIYRFADCRFDPESGALRRPDSKHVLPPRTAALLSDLIARRSRWVAAEELLRRIWPDASVTASSVTTAIAELRRAVGDDGQRQRIVRTRRGHGYRFVAALAGEAAYAERCAEGCAKGCAQATPTDPVHPGRGLASPGCLEAAMRRADGSLERARRSGPRHLDVRGPGARRFAREWASVAADRGFALHRGRRVDRACPVLWPWWQVAVSIRDASGHEAPARPRPEAAEWTRLVREIEWRASRPDRDLAPTDRQRRFGLLDGISRALVRHAAVASPCAVLLEDRDASDVDSEHILEFILASPGPAALWIVTSTEGPRPLRGQPRQPSRPHSPVPQPVSASRVDRVDLAACGPVPIEAAPLP